MSFNYNEMAQLATELIAEFGAPATLRKKGEDSGYDDNGNITAVVPDTLIDGVSTPILSYKNGEIDGQHIQYNDGYIYFDSTAEPEINMTITLNSLTYRVVDVMGIASADGIKVYRKLQLRR